MFDPLWKHYFSFMFAASGIVSYLYHNQQYSMFQDEQNETYTNLLSHL